MRLKGHRHLIMSIKFHKILWEINDVQTSKVKSRNPRIS